MYDGYHFTQDFSGYDDSAEFAKEQAEREEKSKQDFLLPPDPEAILEVRHLKKYFTLKKTLMGKPISSLKAVDDVSFKISRARRSVSWESPAAERPRWAERY